MPIDPIFIGAYIDLVVKLYGIADKFVEQLRADGITDEQLLLITEDFNARIARRQQDAAHG